MPRWFPQRSVLADSVGAPFRPLHTVTEEYTSISFVWLSTFTLTHNPLQNIIPKFLDSTPKFVLLHPNSTTNHPTTKTAPKQHQDSTKSPLNH